MKNYLLILVFLLSGCLALKPKIDIDTNDVNAKYSVEYNFNFTQGTKNKLLGNRSEALLCFSRCIEINPKSSGALFQLSEIYGSAGDMNKAIVFAKKAYELDKENQWYILQLARLYQNSEVIDSTIILYKKLIQIAPAKEEYYLNLSFLYFKNNKPKIATKVLNDFQSKFGITENSAITLYQIYKYTNDNSNCLRILHKAVNKFPGETRFYGLIAEQFMYSQQMDSARVYYEKLLAIDPENDKGLLSFIEYYKIKNDTVNVEKYFSLFFENPKNDLSDKFELLSSFINDKNYRQKFAFTITYYLDSLIANRSNNERVYLLKADFYLRNNDHLKAKVPLLFVVTHFKANYVIWEQLLFTLNSLGQYTELYEYTKQAIALYSDKPLPYLFEGMACYYLKKYNEGIVILNSGLKYIKQSKEFAIQFHTYLGECFQGVSDFAKSDYNFERVLQFDPQNIMVLNNYSYYLALRNISLDKALNYIQVCITKYPNSSTYLDTYGWILFKKGNYLDAKIAIEKALQNGGKNNMDIIEHYSEILFYNNDKANAIKYYKIIEENGKSNSNLKNLLQIE